MKKQLFILAFLFASVHLEAQTFTAKYLTLSKVFDELVNAYGNPKGRPDLVLIPNAEKESYCIAGYFASPKPTIKVDEKLFDICMSMGADSLNALSVIIGHELAHYYYDHNWCTDFAFAIRNSVLGKKIKAETKNSKLGHEREADNFGLYHSCIAGYHPFGIYERLLDTLYQDKAYNIPDKMPGYPSKHERIKICEQAQDTIRVLYQEFLEGNSAISHREYEKAIRCFENLNTRFPSRENYNNAGTAKTLWALQLKPLERQEFEDSNFFYPIEIDHESRLKDNGSRSGLNDEYAKKRDSLLQSARKDFEKAISLDPDYDIAYINIACVFDLMEKPKSAIGKIDELPHKKQSTKSALRILGIAYYHLWLANGHLDDKEKSEEMFAKLNR